MTIKPIYLILLAFAGAAAVYIYGVEALLALIGVGGAGIAAKKSADKRIAEADAHEQMAEHEYTEAVDALREADEAHSAAQGLADDITPTPGKGKRRTFRAR